MVSAKKKLRIKSRKKVSSPKYIKDQKELAKNHVEDYTVKTA